LSEALLDFSDSGDLTYWLQTHTAGWGLTLLMEKLQLLETKSRLNFP
jgi:hypothetical protein